MTRTRNLKPSFFTNEELAECSVEARLLFAGLWLLADREGRLEDRPKRIKAALFPYDDFDVSALLTELSEHDFVTRYQADGHKYLWIQNFVKHQRPHPKEPKSEFPAPPFNYTASSGSSGNNGNLAGMDENFSTASCAFPSSSNPSYPSSSSSLGEVEEVLLRLGISEAESLVGTATERGLSPEEILRCAEVYQEHKDRWDGPGALHYRIARSRPGQDASDLSRGWPKPSQEFLKRLKEQRRESKATQGMTVHRTEKQAADLHDCELETEFGASLDALDVDLLAALSTRVVGENSQLRMLYQRDGPKSRLVRPLLLEALRDQK